MASGDLTTTSYAILGLLDLRDWSAYDLTRQARRSLTFIWPMSESQLYAEPKRLEREGLISITKRPAGPQRTRQEYSITDAGRRELRAWLSRDPDPPRLQAEVMLRMLFATIGTTDDVLGALEATRVAAESQLSYGRTIVEDLLGGDNPFPERLHANIVWMTFVHDLLVLTLRWVEFARTEVEGWRDDEDGANHERIDELLEALLSDGIVSATTGVRADGR